MVGSVSAASESDDLQITNDTDSVSTGHIVSGGVNSANNNMLQSSVDSNILSDGVVDNLATAYDGEILADNPTAGSFNDLNTLLSDTTKTSFELDRNYTYSTSSDSSYTNGIVISRSIEIDGKGHSIDAKNSARIFSITASNVILNNITLKNGNATNGGAIYWNAASGTVNNSYFINNSADTRSGAIHWYGNNAVLCNSYFINNTAGSYMGAIRWGGHYGTIYNSTFINNSAGVTQGAICWAGNYGSISGCNFINNYVGSSGGAIGWNGNNGVVKNSNFTNNVAVGTSGAIDWQGDNAIVTGCMFVNNTANALNDVGVIGNNISVKDNTFEGVYASIDNEVVQGFQYLQIKLTSGNEVLGVKIKVNHDVIGSVRVNANSSSNTEYYLHGLTTGDYVVNIDFSSTENNYVNYASSFKIVGESIIYVSPNGQGDGSESSPTNWNDAMEKSIIGSKIILKDGNYTNIVNQNMKIPYITIIGSGNTIIDAQNKGNMITVNGDHVVLNNLIFKNGNSSSLGGAVIWMGNYGELINSTFINNFGGESGGAVRWNGLYGKVKHSIFSNNAVNTGSSGGAFSSIGISLLIEDSRFVNNGGASMGGAIYCDGEKTTILNSTFINNSCTENGGAIISSGQNSIISNSTFYNNSAVTGGAIRLVGFNSIVKNSTFINNSAVTGGGGAVQISTNNCIVLTSNFTNNTANQGGAVYMSGSYGKISSSIFSNNEAFNVGGAIWIYGDDGLIFNSSFINNTAKSAGGVYWTSCPNGVLNNCTFIDNHVNASSGAVQWNGVNGTLMNSICINNSAANQGGAVLWNGVNGTLMNSICINNSAANQGGAVLWNGDNGKIFNSSFLNNTGSLGGSIMISGNNSKISHIDVSLSNATTSGGAIYVMGENIDCLLEYSNLFNNSATSLGGVIRTHASNGFGNLKISNCNISDNSADNGGAINFGMNKGKLEIINSVFNHNIATAMGGSISSGTNNLVLNYNAFIGITSPEDNGIYSSGVADLNYNWWGSNDGAQSSYFNSPSYVPTTYLKAVLNYVATSQVGDKYLSIVNTRFVKSDTNEIVVATIRPVTYTTTSGTIDNADTESNAYRLGSTQSFGVTATVDNQVLSDTYNPSELDYSFVILKALIDLTDAGETLTINHDYTFDSTVDGEFVEGIVINKKITVDGGGYAVDGNNQARIFNIIGDNVVLYNLNIIKGNSDNGGAIYCNANGLNLKYCTLDSNSVNGYGSHLYLDEEANGVVINGTKFNNGLISSGNGSAIYILSQSHVTICNSTFTGNHAVNGGALNVNSFVVGLKIYNNTFKNNHASNNGGAIAFTSSAIDNLEMYDNTYDSNVAVNYGGAIYSNVGFSESNSRFKSNCAVDGSAIYLPNGETINLTADTFESNEASGHGTVYIAPSVTFSIDDLTTFTGNIKPGNNIYFVDGYAASVIYVSQSGGGSGTILAEPTTLSEALNHISSGGRIIFTNNISLSEIITITNKNIALVGNGHTITGNKRAFTIKDSIVTIENLTFDEFNTDDCVVYYDSISAGSVVDCNFTNQKSGTSALDIEGNINVNNCLFKDNTLSSGGALYYGHSAFGSLSGSTFNNTHSLYITDVDAITLTGNTFVCPSVTIDEIGPTVNYHDTVTINGTFDDGTNRPHTINITSNGVSINVASLTSTKTFSYSYVNLTNGDYSISMNVVDDGNTYTYTAPTRSFTVSPANTIYIGPSATGDGSGVDTSNLATWDTIGTRLASNGIVYFTNGEYSLNQKTISNPWTLTASSADNVLIDGGSNTIFTVNSAGVTIENLTLTSNTRPILGTSTVTVKNSVLYNQLTIDSFSDPVYGDTITISGSIGNIDIASLEAYSGDELIGSTTISGSATTYTITRNGNLAVGSYTLTLSKTDFKEV